MFGRRDKKAAPDPPTATYQWERQLADARATIAHEVPTSTLLARLDEVAVSLRDAEADRARVAAAVDRLDPERSSRELKDALRNEKQRPGSVGDARLAVLRDRHATINRLLDRRDALASQITTTVLDVEVLAAKTVEISALGGDVDQQLGEPLERLRIDVDALAAAHAELRAL